MRNHYLIVLMVLLAVWSCKPSLPNDVLSEGKMEDILYDYHLAIAMSQNGVEEDGNKNGNMITYRTAILKKHNVTSAEFDSSMVYYMRHTELLHEVYKNLSERLNDEALALGGEDRGDNRFGNLSATGDTANIWREATSMVFSPQAPFNHNSFDIEADTTFHKGDSFMLDFNAEFIYQDGMRDGVAVLAVCFQNDSVASQMIRIQNKQHCSVTVTDRDSLGIKRVKGFFLLNKGNFTSDNSETTLKLMFLQQVKLIRMHAKKEKATAEEKKDSVATPARKPIPRPSKNPPVPTPDDKMLKMETADEPLKTR